MPANKTDAATLMHDVDYMIAQNPREAMIADFNAMTRSDWSLEGFVTKIGLAARSKFAPKRFYGGDVESGYILKDYVKNDPRYRASFKSYGMEQTLDDW